MAFAKQMTERCQGWFVACSCRSVRQLDTSQSRLRRASSPIVGEPRALPRHCSVGRSDAGRRCRQPELELAFVVCSNVRPRRRGGPCGRPGRQLQYEPALPITPARQRPCLSYNRGDSPGGGNVAAGDKREALVAFAKQMTERCQGWFVGSHCRSVRQLDTSQSRLRRASSPIVGEPRALPRHRTVGRPDPWPPVQAAGT